MENLISKDESLLFNEINKYREDPSSFSKAFNLTSKFLGRFKNQKANSVELAKCANDLNEFKSLDKFELSEGLSKSANKVLDRVKDFHDKLSSFKKISDKELNDIILEFVEICDHPFLIVDFGSQEQLLPRLMISVLDPERNNPKLIRDSEKRAIEVCSKVINEDETFCSVIIISNFVKEKSNKEDNRIDVDEVIINESKEESQIVNEEKPVVVEEEPVVTEEKPVVTEDKPIVVEEVKPEVVENNTVVTEEKPKVTEVKPNETEEKKEKEDIKDDSGDEFEIKGSNNKKPTTIESNNAPNTKEPTLRSKVKATKQDPNMSKKPIEEVPAEAENKITPTKDDNQNERKEVKTEPKEKKKKK